jgi:hypothetical protein
MRRFGRAGSEILPANALAPAPLRIVLLCQMADKIRAAIAPAETALDSFSWLLLLKTRRH